MSIRTRSRRQELLEKQQGRNSRNSQTVSDKRNVYLFVAMLLVLVCVIVSQQSMNQAMASLRVYSIVSDETVSAMSTYSLFNMSSPAATTSSTGNTGNDRPLTAATATNSPSIATIDITKSSGGNWKEWDRSSVLHADLPGMTCNWSEYKPAHPLSSSTESAPMCLHPLKRDKTVSGSIMDIGRWPDCDILTPILRGHQNSHPDQPLVHVEIGANIGSCIMQVVMTTNATIYAFEPHPENLYHLTSTLLALDESMRNRVHLFPIALGEATSTSTMIINRQNAGNAQVNAPPKQGKAQGATVISIERLDDVLTISHADGSDSSSMGVSLIKMDAQGFECFIVKGMPHLLQYTQALVFEVETRQMTRLGGACSPSKLVKSVQEAKFDILKLNDKTGEETADNIPDFSKFGVQDTIDLIARKHMDPLATSTG